MIKRVSILTLLGVGIGVVVAVLAVGFVEAVLWLNEQFYISRSAREAVSGRPWLTAMTIGIPAAGGLVVGLQSPDTTMPAKSAVVSALAACLSLGAGASVGQYGPLVHMGTSVGSWLGRATGHERSLGTISIACGAAAAISAAFHAPIAGLGFAREVILRHYSLRAFAPIAVASTMAYIMAHMVFKRMPLFRLEEVLIASPYEYPAFAAIGIAGALLAVVYMRAIEFAGKLAEKLPLPVPIRTALAGLALGIVALQVPDVLGIGQEVLRLSLSGGFYSAAELAQLLVAKLLVTALCLGFGFAGGVFSPALLIGTVFGALVGTGVDWLAGAQFPQIAVYAVCGLVAVTGPVIGAPLTAVLIVFELTQNFDLATAAMVSVAFANLVGFRIYGRSFFDAQLKSRGFDLALGRGKVTAQRHSIRDLLVADYTRVTIGQTLAEIRDALVRDRRSEAYVVAADGAYVGTLTLHRVMELFAAGAGLDQPAGELAEPESLALSPDTSIWAAMTEMQGFIGESIPVLEDGRLVGVLFESTVISAYQGVLEDIRKDENAAV